MVERGLVRKVSGREVPDRKRRSRDGLGWEGSGMGEKETKQGKKACR